MIRNDNRIKSPSFRIAHCGKFPNYQLNGIFFKEKNIIYLVSVGKEKFENKWIDRFVNFAKEVQPRKILIVVADTLQRYNIEIDENSKPKQAFSESIKRGKEWVEKYKPIFFNINSNYEFVHWESLKEDEDFERYFHEIKKLDKENITFKEALSISSKKYTNRPSRINLDTDYQKAEANSRQFLIEECAVFQVLAKDKENLAIVYPGAITDVLAYAIRYINENYRTKDQAFHWLDLRPTKSNKKNTNRESNIKESTNSLFFRNTSLNGDVQSEYQNHQNLDRKVSKLSLNS